MNRQVQDSKFSDCLAGFYAIFFKLFEQVVGLAKRTLKLGVVVEVAGKSVRIGPKIAEGGFAFVHTAHDVRDQRVYALKKMLCHDEESLSVANAEADLLMALPQHPNIIRFQGAAKRTVPSTSTSSSGTEVLLLTDFYAGGPLQEALATLKEPLKGFPETALLRVFLDVLYAVSHLHSQNPPVAHRDIKIENLLLEGEIRDCIEGRSRVVLCDMGSATRRAMVYENRQDILQEEERIQRFTTQAYRAPEMVDLYQKKLINEKVDIWALGVLLYTMTYEVFPFDPQSPLATLNGRYVLPPQGHDEDAYSHVNSIIRRCLVVNPEERPSAFQLLEDVRQLLLSTQGGSWAISVPLSHPTATATHGAPEWADFSSSATGADQA